MSNNTTEMAAQIASLKTEVKYLKWIIPAACGFVALLVLIFWGIERENIGKRVSAALDQEGVNSALQEINAAREQSIAVANELHDRLNSLPLQRIKILSTDHSSGADGHYFNFDVSDLDSKLGNSSWHNKNFIIINSRTG